MTLTGLCGSLTGVEDKQLVRSDPKEVSDSNIWIEASHHTSCSTIHVRAREEQGLLVLCLQVLPDYWV